MAINVSASPGIIGAGQAGNLVDGVKGVQGSACNIAFANVDLDESRWLIFDFGLNASVRVTRVTWLGEAKNDGSPAPQGRWQWWASDDMVNWQAIGVSFALMGAGFAVGQVINLPTETGYRAYKMAGVSGQTDGSRWQAEAVFTTAANAEKPLAIFLFSGQSNSEGQAPNPDQSVYTNRERVLNFALDGQWKPAADPLMALDNSKWPALNNVNGPKTSQAMSFGSTIAPTLRNFDVGLVVSSRGSTSIDQWAFNTNPETLAGAMVDRATKALASAPPGSFLAGFIWQQGENDTATEARALAWKPKLDALIASVRGHFGRPDLPVLVMGLGPNPGGASAVGWSVMSAVQRFMSIDGPSAFVPTADLPNSGGADWEITSSVIEIGKRSAPKMRALLPPML